MYRVQCQFSRGFNNKDILRGTSNFIFENLFSPYILKEQFFSYAIPNPKFLLFLLILGLDLCLSIQYSNVPFKDTISTWKGRYLLILGSIGHRSQVVEQYCSSFLFYNQTKKGSSNHHHIILISYYSQFWFTSNLVATHTTCFNLLPLLPLMYQLVKLSLNKCTQCFITHFLEILPQLLCNMYFNMFYSLVKPFL